MMIVICRTTIVFKAECANQGQAAIQRRRRGQGLARRCAYRYKLCCGPAALIGANKDSVVAQRLTVKALLWLSAY